MHFLRLSLAFFCLLASTASAVSLIPRVANRMSPSHVPVDIIGKNFHVTPQLRSYIESKAERMMHKLGQDVSFCHVTLELIAPKEPEHNLHTAIKNGKKVTALVKVKGDGHVLKAVETTDSMHAAVDKSLHNIHRSLAKYHRKKSHSRKVGHSKHMALDATSTAEELEDVTNALSYPSPPVPMAPERRLPVGSPMRLLLGRLIHRVRALTQKTRQPDDNTKPAPFIGIQRSESPPKTKSASLVSRVTHFLKQHWMWTPLLLALALATFFNGIATVL